MRLRRVERSQPGFTRRRQGRGFTYLDADGNRVTDPEVLERIRGLVIPPAWTDVWICTVANGHLQAAGTDDAGRVQYLYHPEWRVQRDRHKFDHVLELAAKLPELRAKCAEDLQGGDGLSRERVIACAVRLLERGSFRIGNDQYADQNGSYGISSIRRCDVQVDGPWLSFDYVAKGGIRREHHLLDPDAAQVVRQLKRRRTGERMFAWKDGRRWVDLHAGDINDYLCSRVGLDATGKDFRTWNATVLVAIGLAVSANATKTQTSRKRAISRAIAETADHLGNTPTVCRASYVDPRVLDRFEEGDVIDLDGLGDCGIDEPAFHGPVEDAVRRLLAD